MRKSYPYDLWAITSYFNPMGYQRRLRNYRIFQESLKVPLLTVELAFHNEFELKETDATQLIQLRSEHVMWQKERLLNLALEQLPPECTKVAWLDCDIVFDSENWPQAASEALDRHPIIQPFEHSYDLKRSESEETYSRENSYLNGAALAKFQAEGKLAENFLQSPILKKAGISPGYAWAARRDLLQRHTLYDSFIIGGGDAAFIAGVFGRNEDLIEIKKMNSQQAAHYLAWEELFHKEVAADLGYIPGNIYHLWHGELVNRNYEGRYHGLAQFDFDPFQDIALAANGCWQWNSAKPELHQYLKDYFAARWEDG